MKTLWAIIDGTSDFMAILAGQALQKAAEQKKTAITVIIRAPEERHKSINAEPAAGDFLFLVGAVEPPIPFAGIPSCKITYEDILEDPQRILMRAYPENAAAPKKIVAITSCPTGIAHTFMAAEGLEQGAAALGYQIRVETQGTVGAESELTPQEIAEADIVIIAADRDIDLSRFSGKPLFQSGTNPAIIDGQALIQKAFASAIDIRRNAECSTD